ncbi:hypothetical protein Adt_48274 [Abeliophyllum distichum]|uniref:Uncharacterized protein n=1 Tax=Abeliophyllum distichum TaxID=126358 RepID=A0ABD1NRL5_9LAMI
MTLRKAIHRRAHKKHARLHRDNIYCARVDQYIMDAKRKCEEIYSNVNIVLEELTDEVRVRSAKMEEIDKCAKMEGIDKCKELHVRIEAHKRGLKEFERKYRDARNRQLLGTHIGYLTETEEKDRS